MVLRNYVLFVINENDGNNKGRKEVFSILTHPAPALTCTTVSLTMQQNYIIVGYFSAKTIHKHFEI